MKHNKFKEISTLVSHSIPVLLTGEKGSGKTTLAMQIAKELKLEFFSISMTRQTTLSHLLGFVNVNGDYIPSQLRKAVDNGGVFLIDEIDAGDANVLLCLNTIENGYISFPGGIVNIHKDFRLIATSNPQDQHNEYVGRNKLDISTLDRFDIVNVYHDIKLESSLVSELTASYIKVMREVLTETNSSITISMRDVMRYQKRHELDLLEGFVFKLLGRDDLMYEKYLTCIDSIPKFTNQNECSSITELFELIKTENTGD